MIARGFDQNITFTVFPENIIECTNSGDIFQVSTKIIFVQCFMRHTRRTYKENHFIAFYTK